MSVRSNFCIKVSAYLASFLELKSIEFRSVAFKVVCVAEIDELNMSLTLIGLNCIVLNKLGFTCALVGIAVFSFAAYRTTCLYFHVFVSFSLNVSYEASMLLTFVLC